MIISEQSSPSTLLFRAISIISLTAEYIFRCSLSLFQDCVSLARTLPSAMLFSFSMPLPRLVAPCMTLVLNCLFICMGICNRFAHWVDRGCGDVRSFRSLNLLGYNWLIKFALLLTLQNYLTRKTRYNIKQYLTFICKYYNVC